MKQKLFCMIVSATLAAGAAVSAVAKDFEPHQVDKTVDGKETATTLEPMDGGGTAIGAYIGKLILDVIIEEAESQLKSIIRDAIFGSSSGLDYVHLSDQALQQIADIVQESNFHDARAQYIQEKDAFQVDLRRYSDDANDEHYNISRLNRMDGDTASLITHRIFNSEYVDSYFMMTDLLAHAAGHRVAVLAELHARGEGGANAVRNSAGELINRLNPMANTAEDYIVGNVRITGWPGSHCDTDPIIWGEPKEPPRSKELLKAQRDFRTDEEIPFVRTRGTEQGYAAGSRHEPVSTTGCSYIVTDSIEGRHAHFHINMYGWQLAAQAANNTTQAWRDEYRVKFIGGDAYQDVIAELGNIRDNYPFD